MQFLKIIDKMCDRVISSGVEKVRELILLLKPTHILDSARTDKRTVPANFIIPCLI
jgi:hypothetical protein